MDRNSASVYPCSHFTADAICHFSRRIARCETRRLITDHVCGLPVFAGGASSFIQLLGPSGGYLLGFPVAAFLTGLLVSREKSFYWNLGACIIGSLPILLMGSLQLNILIGGNLAEAFRLGFIPFIAGDFIKCVLAAAAFTATKKIMSK